MYLWDNCRWAFRSGFPESRVGDKCERYRKGHEPHYIQATPSVEYSTLHLGQYVMRFMPLAVLLALIAHPTSRGTQNETLNGSCHIV